MPGGLISAIDIDSQLTHIIEFKYVNSVLVKSFRCLGRTGNGAIDPAPKASQAVDKAVCGGTSAHANDITEADARAALQQLDPLWDELFPAEHARIVALLVERVDIGVDGLNVRLRVDGLGGLAREMLVGEIGEAA